MSVEHVFAKNYTAEVRYVGTRGIHLDTQNRINVQNRVLPSNQLPTYFGSTPTPNSTNTLASIRAATPRIIPAYSAAGFTSNIVGFYQTVALTIMASRRNSPVVSRTAF